MPERPGKQRNLYREIWAPRRLKVSLRRPTSIQRWIHPNPRANRRNGNETNARTTKPAASQRCVSIRSALIHSIELKHEVMLTTRIFEGLGTVGRILMSLKMLFIIIYPCFTLGCVPQHSLNAFHHKMLKIYDVLYEMRVSNPLPNASVNMFSQNYEIRISS